MSHYISCPFCYNDQIPDGATVCRGCGATIKYDVPQPDPFQHILNVIGLALFIGFLASSLVALLALAMWLFFDEGWRAFFGFIASVIAAIVQLFIVRLIGRREKSLKTKTVFSRRE
ncbi:hypothetical protein [Moraxella pluranimalium]|uniref:Uncharacterized protein n=1 Tax=Moraxella pluranimalium TaxID=470453 RepID=A0A1T0CPA4_9GAMM|nr:hypothetical protein [Moraxella pluranimalium]OOS24177.1 hypothetical protein B0680_05180 [Moraxella pluranimalium]